MKSEAIDANMALLNLVFPPAVHTNPPEAKDDEFSDNCCDHCMKNREGLRCCAESGKISGASDSVFLEHQL